MCQITNLQDATAASSRTCHSNECCGELCCAQEDEATLPLLPAFVAAPVDALTAVAWLVLHSVRGGHAHLRQRLLAFAPLCM